MAQKLKFGNGTWATKKGSTLAYNDENNNYKPLPFTTTRDSIGTRVNKEGLIEVVGNDVPRIDYTDSAEGALLLENSATNLLTYSEAFDNSYWTKSGVSVTSGFISPNGTDNAFKLVEDTSTNHQMYKAISGTSKTLSFFAKSDGRDWIAINCGSLTYFNVALGIVGTVASGSSATIESMSNGWFKCSVTETSAAYGADFSLSKDGTTTAYDGDGTSGVLLWGAQLEANSVASSYIPTSGSSITRQADTASGSGNSEVFNDSEGVLFADISAFSETNSFEAISINDNSTSDRIFMGYYSDDLYITVVDGGQAKYDVNTPINVKQNNKIAVKYKAQDFSFYLNGFEINASVGINGGTTPSGLFKLSFNRGDGVEPFYGKTKEIAYYDEILTDLELETLTSYRSLNELVTELNLNTL